MHHPYAGELSGITTNNQKLLPNCIDCCHGCGICSCFLNTVKCYIFFWNALHGSKQLFRVSAMASCERRCSVELSIEKKKLVLDELGKGRSHRSIAADFGISKTTVGNIYKKRETVLRTWRTSANRNHIYRKRKSRRTTNEELWSVCQGE